MVDSNRFDYSKSALIIYNMQKGNPGNKTMFPRLVPKIRELINAAHDAGRPVIYGQHVSLPYEYQSKYYVYWLEQNGHDAAVWSSNWRDGGEYCQIIDELKPTAKDHVIKKYVASFFVGTNAEEVLKNKGVETIILTGVGTSHGIESTARHATFIGLMPVIVEDAIASKNSEWQEASVTLMRDVFHCDVQKTDYVVRRLRDGMQVGLTEKS